MTPSDWIESLVKFIVFLFILAACVGIYWLLTHAQPLLEQWARGWGL